MSRLIGLTEARSRAAVRAGLLPPPAPLAAEVSAMGDLATDKAAPFWNAA